MELGWLKALPDELIHVRPVLSVAYAYALFGGGELESVEDWLRNAERWLDTTAERRGQSEPPLAGMVVVDEKEFRRLPGMIALLRTAQALSQGNMRLRPAPHHHRACSALHSVGDAGVRRVKQRRFKHADVDEARVSDHGEPASMYNII